MNLKTLPYVVVHWEDITEHAHEEMGKIGEVVPWKCMTGGILVPSTDGYIRLVREVSGEYVDVQVFPPGCVKCIEVLRAGSTGESDGT